jgi:hypothetical protein
MTDPLTTLQTDLNTLATADTSDPPNGTAAAQPPLTAAQQVLSLLADQALVGSAISTSVSGVYSAIATAITDDVVKALQAVAGELNSPSMAGLNLNDATSALSSLQNAQSLVPGGSSAVASAFASTSQFATLFGNLLQDAGSLATAANTLYEIAQQLEAVAAAFTAAKGNP